MDDNFPGLLKFAEFDTNSRFMAINCDTEEIADTIQDEMNCLLEYFSLRKKEEEEMTKDMLIAQKIQEVEEKLAELKSLFTQDNPGMFIDDKEWEKEMGR